MMFVLFVSSSPTAISLNCPTAGNFSHSFLYLFCFLYLLLLFLDSFLFFFFWAFYLLTCFAWSIVGQLQNSFL